MVNTFATTSLDVGKTTMWLERNHKYLFAASCTCGGAEPAVTPADRLPQDYLQRVKAIHEGGGFGSIGYAPIYGLLAYTFPALCLQVPPWGNVVVTDVRPSVHANCLQLLRFTAPLCHFKHGICVSCQSPGSTQCLASALVPAHDLPLLYGLRSCHREEGTPCSFA